MLSIAGARLQVKSFGVGRTVKLPGASKSQPNTYAFGKPYAEIHADLLSKDEELYTRNGLLAMVRRNMGVKAAPERWQENTTCAGGHLSATRSGMRWMGHALQGQHSSLPFDAFVRKSRVGGTASSASS